MAFRNEQLQLLANRFKKRFKALNENVKAWAMDTEISLNTAYSYMDVNRPDNPMPAFLLATLPDDSRESLLQMIRDMATYREAPERHGTTHELLALHFRFLKEFSDVTRSIVEAMEDGKISEEEFSSYEKERAEFLAIDARLHARLRRESTWIDESRYT
jgi:hypothetical protein